MSLHEFSVPLNVVTPLGPALAIMVETDLDDAVWCCADLATGELWWLKNRYVRLAKSITNERFNTSHIHVGPEMREALEKARQPKLIIEDWMLQPTPNHGHQ